MRVPLRGLVSALHDIVIAVPRGDISSVHSGRGEDEEELGRRDSTD